MNAKLYTGHGMESEGLLHSSAARGTPRSSTLAPVAGLDRISSIDVLRGAALLGICLMNIVSAGLVKTANLNPNVSGGSTGPNLAAFVVQHILFDGKMRGLFSMMFGASACLLIGRLETQGAGIRAAEVYYRRVLWLMVFGIIHAYLIWQGDILYPYALWGLVLLPLVRASAKSLLIAAGVLLLIMCGQTGLQGFQIRKIHDLAGEAQRLKIANKPLTEQQKAAISKWEEMRKSFSPPPEDVREERNLYSGSYFRIVAKRAEVVIDLHSTPFYLNGLDTFIMMLVGIAFIKSDVLSAARSKSFYWRLLSISLAIGLPISVFGTWKAWQDQFERVSVSSQSTFPIGQAGLTISHAAVLLLVCKYGLWPRVQLRTAAVGRMAFSNYIAHSVIFGFVFYGYGLNLFDKLQRYQLYYVVPVLWMFSLIWSPMWLRHFRFGPLEWGWRSLTYWQRQPMRIGKGAADSE